MADHTHADPPAKLQKTAEPAPPAPPPAEKKKFDDLAEHMDLDKCSVLNAADPGILKSVLQGVKVEGEESKVIKSDCDEQLLFGIVFAQPVRLQSIRLSAPSAAPRTVKLFINRDNMAFEDVEDTAATQTLSVSGGAPSLLQFVKFQCVCSITVFVEDNHDDAEVTCVERLAFVGEAIHKTNMNDLKKGG